MHTAVAAAFSKLPSRGPTLRFEHPEPEKSASGVVPVFIPFAGCPGRCVFCDQRLTTGDDLQNLEIKFNSCRSLLDEMAQKSGPPMELAFYGGTFTALPGEWSTRFTALAGEYKRRGVLNRIRCSTRPDAVDSKKLLDLKGLGLDLVELGVQSFDAEVLLRSRRGHGPEAVHRAARLVRGAGLGLGVQLLPGLPGMDERIFERDVLQALALEPDCARLYPLQVLEGTELARMWREGRYAAWGLEETIERLGLALDAFWRAGIRVIRVGLAPEPALEAGVLAGPRHPAMGQLAKGRALFLTVQRHVRALGRTPVAIGVPARWFSDVVGHQGRMLPLYAALGLSREKIVRAGGRFFELC